MRSRIDNAAGGRPDATSFGETAGRPGRARPSGPRRGGIVLRATDPNPERVCSTTLLAPVPPANVGDTLPGATVGVARLLLRQLQAARRPRRRPWPAAACRARSPGRRTRCELAVATFNVENLAPTDPQAKFDALAAARRHNLASAGHPRAGGGPGQQRRRPTTAWSPPTRRSASSSPRSARPAGRRTSAARSTRSTTPTAASRAATSGWRSCSAPTAGCRSWTGRAATSTTATAGRRGTRPAGRS